MFGLTPGELLAAGVALALGLPGLYLAWQEVLEFREQNRLTRLEHTRHEGATTAGSAMPKLSRLRVYIPMVAMGLFMLATWAAVGYSVYDRHHVTAPQTAPLSGGSSSCGNRMSQDMQTGLAGVLGQLQAKLGASRLPSVVITEDTKFPRHQLAEDFLDLFQYWSPHRGKPTPETRKGAWFSFSNDDPIAREFYSALENYALDIRPDENAPQGLWAFYIGSNWCDGQARELTGAAR